MPRRPNARPMQSRPDTMRNLTLQRRHYQFIADILATWRADPEPVDIVKYFAFRLKGTNPGFDVDRFIAACGGPSEPKPLCLLCQSEKR